MSSAEHGGFRRWNRLCLRCGYSMAMPLGHLWVCDGCGFYFRYRDGDESRRQYCRVPEQQWVDVPMGTLMVITEDEG